ncbi:hypothetical protein HGRIS_014605 [Hohenbuehelia grisea]|uniref:DUF5648 domain-containing protein n=1 Tax=Hohenbuehelia grisea TaxID=104357 RepID=A0ABR3JVR8_9AGAR
MKFTFALLALAVLVAPAAAAPTDPPPPDCPPGSQTTLYRLWNNGINDHFFTTDPAEVKEYSGLGYVQENIPSIRIYKSPAYGTVPFQRVYSAHAKDHLYTNDDDEVRFSQSMGYKPKSSIGFILPQPCRGSKPLHRLWNEQTLNHFYTADVPERDKFVSQNGYKYEGVVAHVL